MKDIQFNNYKIKRLIDIAESKQFAVPELQREFVWDAKRACRLLDSIHKGLPIGTMMLWDTTTKHRDLLRHQLHILPEFDNHNDSIWFLIDGQQRLSVIYQVHKGDKIENASGKIINFGQIYFDLTGSDKLRFVSRKNEDSNNFARVTDILSNRWRSKFRNWPKGKKSAIEDCRNRIREYRIPVTLLYTNHLEAVRESFLRINSQGMTIGSADKAFARATKLPLRHLVHEARVGWQDKGYDKLPDQIILSALALLDGQNDVGDSAIEAFVRRLDKRIDQNHNRTQFSKEWAKLRECFGKAIDYLYSNFSVINYDFLPSDNMLMLLALFFYFNNKAQPNTRQRQELRKWFWATGIAQRYSGRGHRQNILKDFAFFKRLGRLRKGTFEIENRIQLSQIRNCDFSRRSALNNTFFCLLALNKPRYLENGDDIPLANYSARSNRENKHHIFPRDLMRRRGFLPNQYNSICNICFLVAHENQSINNSAPRVYLDEYKKPRNKFIGVMKSHLIPYNTDSGLWYPDIRRGFRIFVNQRLQVLHQAFEAEAGIKLFQRD